MYFFNYTVKTSNESIPLSPHVFRMCVTAEQVRAKPQTQTHTDNSVMSHQKTFRHPREENTSMCSMKQSEVSSGVAPPIIRHFPLSLSGLVVHEVLPTVYWKSK